MARVLGLGPRGREFESRIPEVGFCGFVAQSVRASRFIGKVGGSSQFKLLKPVILNNYG